ncbi:MAG: hypothetical protein QHJ73_15235 [Armatimonadota bacterium]|nr:hypothetical protein [Armatimonadota bacterium]
MGKPKETSRRELLRLGARWAMLAGLGTGTALLVRRGGIATCVAARTCAACPVWEACGLPWARKAKPGKAE